MDNPLAGSWQLLSYEVANSTNETVVHPLGRDARGWLLYSADGRMSVQIMSAGRDGFEDQNPLLASSKELADAARGYLAYTGRYELADGIVSHHIDCSLFPNWCGQTQERVAVLSGDTLELVPVAPIVSNGVKFTARLRWRRNA